MEDKVKVSVCCVAFNHEEYIRDALEGFVNQKTDFSYEVIVHDDASTDRTAQIIREYESKYPHIIKPIYQASNQYSQKIPIIGTHILPKVRGEYIALCEGDDYWTDPYKLQIQVEFLDKHPEYSACVHETTHCNMRTSVNSLINGHKSDYDLRFSDVIRGGNMCFQLSSLVFRNQYAHQVFRSQAEDNRPVFFQKAKGFGDYPLAIYLVLCGKVRFLARNMSTYRFLSEGSWTSRHNTTDVSKKIDHYHSVLSMLEEVDRFTKGEYHSTINRTKLNYEYDLYRLTHKGILPKPKFIPVYMMRQMHRVANKVGITWK